MLAQNALIDRWTAPAQRNNINAAHGALNEGTNRTGGITMAGQSKTKCG